MNTREKVKDAAMQSGMGQTGFISVKELVLYPEIRKICEENTCRNYGTTWACPPAVGTLEECRERLNRYDTMLLFSRSYNHEDPFDIEGMRKALLAFKHTVDQFDVYLKPFLKDYLLLSNEGCGRCAGCTYPDAPCRYPELLNPSIEGYGLQISELAEKASMQYYGGSNTVNFFGGLLFKDRP